MKSRGFVSFYHPTYTERLPDERRVTKTADLVGLLLRIRQSS
jgi:hypothetical protein